MATSYPGGLDSFTNPTATDSLNSASVPHATQHANANDAIEAIETELGTNPKGAAASVKARFDAIEAAGWVTSTRILDGTIVNDDINASAAIAQSKIANLTTDLANKAPATGIAQSAVTNLVTDLASKAPATCLWLSGTAGNSVSCPDVAILDITGDIDIIVRVALDDWTPSANSALLGKRAASNYSYLFYVATGGTLNLAWSADGTTEVIATSTAATGLTDGTAKWVRATLDVNNGASGNDTKFYLSDDGSTWTQLGSTVTKPGTTSLFSGTSRVDIGAYGSGNNMNAAGKFYRAIVKSGIDGSIVADWRGTTPAARYRDAYANVWTVNGSANAYMEA